MDWRKLIHLKSQESLMKINEYIDTSRYHIINSKEDIGRTSYRVIWSLWNVIENEDFKILVKNVREEMWEDTAPYLAVKNCLIKNKGKYKIAKIICPY